MLRRVVYHAEAPFADHPGDAGGQEGLAQPRLAHQQQVVAAGGELPGVVLTHVVVALHVLPGGQLPLAPLRAVPVKGEGLKALAAQIQQLRQFLQLGPLIILPQAAAHLTVLIPGVAAQGAGGLLLQIVRRIAHAGQQLGPLALQLQIFVPQHPHRRQRIHAPPQGRGDQLGHGGAQLLLDLPQLRFRGVEPVPPAGKVRPAALLVLLEPGQRLTHDPSVVCHCVPLLVVWVECSALASATYLFLSPVGTGMFRAPGHGSLLATVPKVTKRTV